MVQRSSQQHDDCKVHSSNPARGAFCLIVWMDTSVDVFIFQDHDDLISSSMRKMKKFKIQPKLNVEFTQGNQGLKRPHDLDYEKLIVFKKPLFIVINNHVCL